MIKRNLVYNVIYHVLLNLLPLITAPYISRTLGATTIGIYSYTNSVAYYFLLFAMLGISNHGNRCVAAARDNKSDLNKVFSSIFLLQMTTFGIAIVAYIGYIIFFEVENSVIAILQLLYVASGLFDINWLFFGLEKFKFTVTRNVIIKLVSVVCIFIFVQTANDLWKYTLIMSAGVFLSQLFLWTYVRKFVSFTRVSFSVIISNIKPIFYMFIPVLSYSIYKVMDKIMLGNMATYEQVGFFQSSDKIINIPMGIITALGTVMLPRMSNIIAKGDTEKTQEYIRISLKFVTILCSAIAFGLMGISPVFTPIYLGSDFAECAPIITLLSISMFSVAWANVIRTQYLIPLHYDRVYILSTLIGAVLNFIVNYFLIPVYQAYGAAIGTIVAEFSVMIIQVVSVRKAIPVLRYIWSYTPVILSGFAMLLITREIGSYFGTGVFTLLGQIFIGGLFFCCVILMFMVFSKDEMYTMIMKNIKSKKKYKTKAVKIY